MNIKKSVVLRSVLITLGALAVFAVVAGFLISYYSREATKKELYREFGVFDQILSSGVPAEDAVTYGTRIADLRITVVSPDGHVVADSNADVPEMGSHLGREEISAALEGEERFAVRVSDTLNVRMMYYAKRTALPDGAAVVLRVAIPVSSLNGYVTGAVVTLVVLVAAVSLLSYLVSLRAYKRVTQPYAIIKKGLRNINNGTYTEIMPRFKDDDLNETLSEINDFAARIKAAVQEKECEREKLNDILENMRQGIVVVNGEEDIVLMNRFAADVLGAPQNLTRQNLMFLTREPAFFRAVENALENRVSAAFDYVSASSVYEVDVTSLLSSWAGEGKEERLAVVTLRSVTEVRDAERARSEFFANASHELKTPLTSVKGFAELLHHDMVKDEAKVKEYTGRIVADSDRMLELIDDMLKLSRLDEGEQAPTERCNLPEIVAEVLAGLTVEAEKKGVKFVTELEDAPLTANRENIAELVKNLAENAVKYNREGGTVTVRVFRRTDGRTVIGVEDTGIGIPKEHQTRVFERFYRVDKGRSRSAGGTGLGLAIVKHVAALYHAEITLKSQPGEYTDIRVIF